MIFLRNGELIWTAKVNYLNEYDSYDDCSGYRVGWSTTVNGNQVTLLEYYCN